VRSRLDSISIGFECGNQGPDPFQTDAGRPSKVCLSEDSRAIYAHFEVYRRVVESECGAVTLGQACVFSAPFVWRCLSGSTIAPFPHPASSNRTCRSPASGSRTRPHAFTHDGPRPRWGQAYEPEVPVEVREWIRPAPSSPDLMFGPQPPAATAPLCSYRARDRLGVMSRH